MRREAGEDGGGAWEVEVAGVRAEEVETMGGEESGPGGADEKGDVAAGGKEAGAKIPAKGAGTENEDAHGVILAVAGRDFAEDG